MNRRSMIVSTTAFIGANYLHAQCGIPSSVGTICRAQLSLPQIMLDAQVQQCPEWCWAASAAMIFTFHGHPIDQKQIVLRTYHQLACWPAMSNANMASALSGDYIDNMGNNFTAKITAAFDAQLGFSNIDNSIVVNELNNGRPLIICNTHHAMVLSLVDYQPMPAPNPPRVLVGGVIDPWPYSPRVHNLSYPEIVPLGLPISPGIVGQMMFLASVETT